MNSIDANLIKNGTIEDFVVVKDHDDHGMTKYYICQNPHCGCWVMVDESKPVIKRMGGPFFCPICGKNMEQKKTVYTNSDQSVAWPEERTRQ